MDRGAARSRKRAQQLVKPVDERRQDSSSAGPSRARARAESNSEAGPSRARGGGGSHAHGGGSKGKDRDASSEKSRHPKKSSQRRNIDGPVEQSRDPALYRPKAIRDATALVYSQDPFAFPPPDLSHVTRLDLEGSGVTDIEWLKGSRVTWLSLKGCQVERGWDAVGALGGLTVLNVSDCGLETLPRALEGCSRLKAFVGMNNPWEVLDEDIVGHWTELNSMIISHSLNLVKLPATLGRLYHLAKLTFSHCPKLTCGGIPDMSNLPVLRDVKMNNLLMLNDLSDHLAQWGRGSMSVLQESSSTSSSSTTTMAVIVNDRHGAGLQSIDIGNCALTWKTISSIFLSSSSRSTTDEPSFPNLRSLTLHGNPACLTEPTYPALLSSALPRLQIVDNKRVKEKTEKKERETKLEKKERERKQGKMKPSGNNQATFGPMRKWGQPEDTPEVKNKGTEMDAATTTGEKKRKTAVKPQHERNGRPGSLVDSNKVESMDKKRKAIPPDHPGPEGVTSSEPKAKKPRRKDEPSQIAEMETKSTTKSKPSKVSKSQTSVVGVVDVVGPAQNKHKPSSSSKATTTAGIDLKSLFDKDRDDNDDDDKGLGVGSW
ncbi:hypothetical protein BD324DRAFT_43502 [Kockovaella imperatae]|uniref:Uncharacterized protein n=1 Tax=Kockovaella imperatae TaxID=4999 RepID=A0A1Y1USZ3_9TREE|nr:hypothetical protein BD324DRAFT_43502 [Kockovaella imperatae]ORX41130.1 hypothetical protein BD324DRAFT_43502 [Kockovaella imperatae]